jgi:hypothetical protein
MQHKPEKIIWKSHRNRPLLTQNCLLYAVSRQPNVLMVMDKQIFSLSFDFYRLES